MQDPTRPFAEMSTEELIRRLRASQQVRRDAGYSVNEAYSADIYNAMASSPRLAQQGYRLYHPGAAGNQPLGIGYAVSFINKLMGGRTPEGAIEVVGTPPAGAMAVDVTDPTLQVDPSQREGMDHAIYGLRRLFTAMKGSLAGGGTAAGVERYYEEGWLARPQTPTDKIIDFAAPLLVGLGVFGGSSLLGRAAMAGLGRAGVGAFLETNVAEALGGAMPGLPFGGGAAAGLEGTAGKTLLGPIGRGVFKPGAYTAAQARASIGGVWLDALLGAPFGAQEVVYRKMLAGEDVGLGDIMAGGAFGAAAGFGLGTMFRGISGRATPFTKARTVQALLNDLKGTPAITEATPGIVSGAAGEAAGAAGAAPTAGAAAPGAAAAAPAEAGPQRFILQKGATVTTPEGTLEYMGPDARGIPRWRNISKKSKPYAKAPSAEQLQKHNEGVATEVLNIAQQALMADPAAKAKIAAEQLASPEMSGLIDKARTYAAQWLVGKKGGSGQMGRMITQLRDEQVTPWMAEQQINWLLDVFTNTNLPMEQRLYAGGRLFALQHVYKLDSGLTPAGMIPIGDEVEAYLLARDVMRGLGEAGQHAELGKLEASGKSKAFMERVRQYMKDPSVLKDVDNETVATALKRAAGKNVLKGAEKGSVVVQKGEVFQLVEAPYFGRARAVPVARAGSESVTIELDGAFHVPKPKEQVYMKDGTIGVVKAVDLPNGTLTVEQANGTVRSQRLGDIHEVASRGKFKSAEAVSAHARASLEATGVGGSVEPVPPTRAITESGEEVTLVGVGPKAEEIIDSKGVTKKVKRGTAKRSTKSPQPRPETGPGSEEWGGRVTKRAGELATTPRAGEAEIGAGAYASQEARIAEGIREGQAEIVAARQKLNRVKQAMVDAGPENVAETQPAVVEAEIDLREAEARAQRRIAEIQQRAQAEHAPPQHREIIHFAPGTTPDYGKRVLFMTTSGPGFEAEWTSGSAITDDLARRMNLHVLPPEPQPGQTLYAVEIPREALQKRMYKQEAIDALNALAGKKPTTTHQSRVLADAKALESARIFKVPEDLWSTAHRGDADLAALPLEEQTTYLRRLLALNEPIDTDVATAARTVRQAKQTRAQATLEGDGAAQADAEVLSAEASLEYVKKATAREAAENRTQEISVVQQIHRQAGRPAAERWARVKANDPDAVVMDAHETLTLLPTHDQNEIPMVQAVFLHNDDNVRMVVRAQRTGIPGAVGEERAGERVARFYTVRIIHHGGEGVAPKPILATAVTSEEEVMALAREHGFSQHPMLQGRADYHLTKRKIDGKQPAFSAIVAKVKDVLGLAQNPTPAVSASVTPMKSGRVRVDLIEPAVERRAANQKSLDAQVAGRLFGEKEWRDAKIIGEAGDPRKGVQRGSFRTRLGDKASREALADMAAYKDKSGGKLAGFSGEDVGGKPLSPEESLKAAGQAAAVEGGEGTYAATILEATEDVGTGALVWRRVAEPMYFDSQDAADGFLKSLSFTETAPPELSAFPNLAEMYRSPWQVFNSLPSLQEVAELHPAELRRLATPIATMLNGFRTEWSEIPEQVAVYAREFARLMVSIDGKAPWNKNIRALLGQATVRDLAPGDLKTSWTPDGFEDMVTVQEQRIAQRRPGVKVTKVSNLTAEESLNAMEDQASLMAGERAAEAQAQGEGVQAADLADEAYQEMYLRTKKHTSPQELPLYEDDSHEVFADILVERDPPLPEGLEQAAREVANAARGHEAAPTFMASGEPTSPLAGSNLMDRPLVVLKDTKQVAELLNADVVLTDGADAAALVQLPDGKTMEVAADRLIHPKVSPRVPIGNARETAPPPSAARLRHIGETVELNIRESIAESAGIKPHEVSIDDVVSGLQKRGYTPAEIENWRNPGRNTPLADGEVVQGEVMPVTHNAARRAYVQAQQVASGNFDHLLGRSPRMGAGTVEAELGLAGVQDPYAMHDGFSRVIKSAMERNLDAREPGGNVLLPFNEWDPADQNLIFNILRRAQYFTAASKEAIAQARSVEREGQKLGGGVRKILSPWIDKAADVVDEETGKVVKGTVRSQTTIVRKDLEEKFVPAPKSMYDQLLEELFPDGQARKAYNTYMYGEIKKQLGEDNPIAEMVARAATGKMGTRNEMMLRTWAREQGIPDRIPLPDVLAELEYRRVINGEQISLVANWLNETGAIAGPGAHLPYGNWRYEQKHIKGFRTATLSAWGGINWKLWKKHPQTRLMYDIIDYARASMEQFNQAGEHFLAKLRGKPWRYTDKDLDAVRELTFKTVKVGDEDKVVGWDWDLAQQAGAPARLEHAFREFAKEFGDLRYEIIRHNLERGMEPIEFTQKLADPSKKALVISALERHGLSFDDIDEGAIIRLPTAFNKELREAVSPAAVNFGGWDSANIDTFISLLRNYKDATTLASSVADVNPEFLKVFDFWQAFGKEGYWPLVHEGSIGAFRLDPVSGEEKVVAWAPSMWEATQALMKLAENGTISATDNIVVRQTQSHVIDEALSQVMETMNAKRANDFLRELAKTLEFDADEVRALVFHGNIPGARGVERLPPAGLSHAKIRRADLRPIMKSAVEEYRFYRARIARAAFQNSLEKHYNTIVVDGDGPLARSLASQAGVPRLNQILPLERELENYVNRALGRYTRADLGFDWMVAYGRMLGDIPRRGIGRVKGVVTGKPVEPIPSFGDLHDRAGYYFRNYAARSQASDMIGWQSIFRLAGSVGSAFANATQFWANTLPLLIDEKTSSTQAAKYAAQAYADAGRLWFFVQKQGAKAFFGAEAGDVAKLSPRLQTLLRNVQEAGEMLAPGKHLAGASNNAHWINQATLRAPWGRSLPQRSMDFVKWGLMMPFNGAEQMNRYGTFIAAFNKAIDQGYSESAAQAFAKDLVKGTQFVYDELAMPRLYAEMGPVGRLFFQFKGFPLNQLSFEKDLVMAAVRREPAAMKRLLAHTLMLGVGGGTVGLASHPFWGPVAKVLGMPFGKDWSPSGQAYAAAEDRKQRMAREPEGREAMLANEWVHGGGWGGLGRDVINYGLPGVVGLSVGRRIGVSGQDLTQNLLSLENALGPQGAMLMAWIKAGSEYAGQEGAPLGRAAVGAALGAGALTMLGGGGAGARTLSMLTGALGGSLLATQGDHLSVANYMATDAGRRMRSEVLPTAVKNALEAWDIGLYREYDTQWNAINNSIELTASSVLRDINGNPQYIGPQTTTRELFSRLAGLPTARREEYSAALRLNLRGSEALESARRTTVQLMARALRDGDMERYYTLLAEAQSKGYTSMESAIQGELENLTTEAMRQVADQLTLQQRQRMQHQIEQKPR